jgi:peptidoglycan-N-acetylglucosamine deacetylase
MNIIYNALVYTVWFIATYYVVLLLLIMIAGKDRLHEKKKWCFDTPPRVSILVPAYNEEKKIKFTIESLKKVKYDNIEFIVINDGSKDNTSKMVKEGVGNDKRFRFIDRKQNKGKAASLNEGIKHSTGEFIATMDADSVVEPKMFQKVLPYFHDKKVGAVTVSVLVKNPKSFLHKIFEFEYVIGLSLFLKTFSTFDAIFVTPGPFSVYRKTVLEEIKGFDEGNITEDLEIAYRLQRKHYRIENCMDAHVYTILPPTFRQICIQRKRWYSGAILTVRKHHDMLLNSKYGLFGYFIFINYLLIALGLIVFGSSLYLLAKHAISNIGYYSYTGFHIIDWIRHFHFDILNYGRTTILGTISILFTVATLIIGLTLTRTKFIGKKIGVAGFLLMFFLYQLFWTIAIAAVARGRKIKWR